MDSIASTHPADADAFTALIDRHRGIIFKVAGTYARGADRDDLAQDITAQLWRAWPRYDPSRPFSTWMYRIALNVGISFLRGEGLHRQHAVPLDDRLHDIADDNAHDPARDDGLRLLHGFIATLAPLDRALLLLYLEERGTREMADVLGITDSNVTTRLSRLRQRLREHAAQQGHH
jgi:RNA polymerase sigma-70 factor (ECF subfamily)